MDHPLTGSESCHEDELLTLHQACLELVQTSDWDQLLLKIGSLAKQQVGAEFAVVILVSATGEIQSFTPFGVAPEQAALIGTGPSGVGMVGAALQTMDSLRVANITDDPRSTGIPEHHPDLRSLLAVPMIHSRQRIGQIYLANKLDAVEFSAEDQDQIEIFASYAAIALRNSRLYRELIERDHILTRRNENLALLNELGSTLATSSDMEQILDKALTQVLDYLQLDVGEIFLRQENARALKLMLHRGQLVSALWGQSQYAVGEGTIGKVAKTGQAQVVLLDSQEANEFDPQLREKRVRQVASLPITSRQGTIGVLSVASTHPRALDELEMQYLATIGFWVGTAIESLRLNMQGRKLAVLEERERIGMDLHDGIIQSIYAIGLTLEHARLIARGESPGMTQRLEQAITDLNAVIRDIRAYILDLRPRQLQNETLILGIRRLMKEFHANTLVNAELQATEEETAGISSPQAVALFHICQEALANIGKHARAKNVTIAIWKSAERYLMEISDDGQGFDMSQTRLSIGHGLTNMQSRAQAVGGDAEISSEPGQGTTILVWVPASEEK